MKICPDCKLEKPFQDFHSDISKKDQCATYCKLCAKVRTRRDYLLNREKRLATCKDYRLRNPENVKRRQRRYADANREQKKEYHAKWRAENKEKHYEDLTARMKYLVAACRSRARDKKHNCDITWQGAYVIIKTQNLKCALTGVEFDFSRAKDRRVHPFAPSIDRKDSSKGYSYDNVQFVCWIVNQAKSDYAQEQFDAMCRARVEQLNRG